MASLLYRVVASFLSHAETAGWVIASPLPRRGLAVLAPRVKARERMLIDDELRSVWHAAGRLNPKPRAFLHLLIMCGVREMEAADIATGEVDLAAGRWSLPAVRTKSRRALVLPLHPLLLAELEAVWPHHDAGTGWKLLGSVAGSGLRGFSRVKQNLDKLSGVSAWRFHDLRRSCRSGLSALGVPMETAERALNHVVGSSLVQVYDRHSFTEEVVAALGKWQRHVAALVGASPTVEVVAFPGRRRRQGRA